MAHVAALYNSADAYASDFDLSCRDAAHVQCMQVRWGTGTCVQLRVLCIVAVHLCWDAAKL